jgi:hypothetical protein
MCGAQCTRASLRCAKALADDRLPSISLPRAPWPMLMIIM